MIQNNKWSILIWSIFLVLFISFSFLSISNWIKKWIENNNWTISKIQSEISIDNFSYDMDKIQTKDVLSIENKFLWNYQKTLYSNKVEKINFSQNNTWSIELKEWAWIKYDIFSWTTNIWSGIVEDYAYDIRLYSWSYIELKSLGWLSKLEMSFTTKSWVVLPNNFKIIKQDISWNELIKKVIQY